MNENKPFPTDLAEAAKVYADEQQITLTAKRVRRLLEGAFLAGACYQNTGHWHRLEALTKP